MPARLLVRLLVRLLALPAFVPDPGLFFAAWRAFGRGLQGGAADGIGERAFAELDGASEKAGWPARHHGRAWPEACEPAYRVLTGREADRLVGTGEGTR